MNPGEKDERNNLAGPKKQESRCVCNGTLYKIRHRPTLTPVTAIPSALAGLTALFGMGRGGHRRYRHLNTFISVRYAYRMYDIEPEENKRERKATASAAEKSVGLLVLLSFDVATFTPAAYQPRNLRGPYMEV